MSSHHFVKEKQEPALYIHSEESIHPELLGELLEWSPFVIADELVLYILNHEPIKIDVVVQQELSTDEINSWLEYQANARVLSLAEGADKIQSVLNYIEKEQHHAISIIGCSEEHQHTLDFKKYHTDIIFYTAAYKSFFVEKEFSKWKAKGSQFVFEVEEATVKNLQKLGDYWEVCEDGLVSIQVNTKTRIKEYNIDR